MKWKWAAVSWVLNNKDHLTEQLVSKVRGKVKFMELFNEGEKKGALGNGDQVENRQGS